jgi:hypothetical protein
MERESERYCRACQSTLSAVVDAPEGWQCPVCDGVYCDDCEAVLREKIKICPSCLTRRERMKS